MLEERAKEWTRQWKQEGRLEGIQEGEEKGRLEGKAEGIQEILLKQLESKFMPIPEECLAKVSAAKREDLLLWAERVLRAESIEQVFH